MSNGRLTITAYVHDDDPNGNGYFEVASTDQTVNVKTATYLYHTDILLEITQKQEKEQH